MANVVRRVTTPYWYQWRYVCTKKSCGQVHLYQVNICKKCHWPRISCEENPNWRPPKKRGQEA